MDTFARSTTLATVVPAIPYWLITSIVASIIFCRFQALMASRPEGLGIEFMLVCLKLENEWLFKILDSINLER